MIKNLADKVCKYSALILAGLMFALVFFIPKRNNPDIKKKKKKVKQLKKSAGKNIMESKKEIRKARDGKNKRKNVRNKYSKIISVLALLLFGLCWLTPALRARFIVYDPEDQVNRDYGTITNYVLSLEEEKIIFLATQGHLYNTITYYSNAYDDISEVADLQKQIIKNQEPPWYEKLWEALDFYVGIGVTAALFLLF